ncbi:MAG: NAD/NADP octopine/nopaline dehydrogenase family protein [Deltaproteobacteria bacterium]|nr:NAD/NADP octopine/nopaline dehydrogenase family protein [Deltaproteobacteria bacterium]
MDERITVIGAGGTGLAAAADLTLAGHRVTLYEEPEFEKNLRVVADRGGITLTGAGRTGRAKVDRVTTDIREALDGSKVVLVAVVASRHRQIGRLCAPFLQDGQVVVFSPGNAGSLVLAGILRDAKHSPQVKIAELEGNLYPSRVTGEAEAIIGMPFKSKYISAFPARDTREVIATLSPFYAMQPAANVIEAALNSPNVVIHLAASLLNLSAVEQSGGSFYLYKTGLTSSVLRCVEAMQEEKLRVFNALGYNERSPLDHLKKVAKTKEFPEFDLFRGLIGPTSATHRYITEDASTGVSLMISLAEMLGVPVPTAKALVSLASAINQVDYFGEGRTLKNLGMAHLTPDQLNRFLVEGEMPPNTRTG